MSELSVYWRTEWKLLLRGPFIGVLLLLGAGHGWLVYSVNDDIFDYGYLIQQFGFLYSMPISILALLAGVNGARRDKALRTDRLLGGLPYRSGRLLAVRFTVAAVPFVLLGLVSAGLLLVLSAFRLEEAAGLSRSLLVMVPLSAGMVYAVALGWALGTLAAGRVGYVLGFAVWFVHVYLMLLVIDPNLPAPLNGLFNFMLFDYKSMGFYNDLWGFLNDRTLWLHRALYAFLTLFILFMVWHAELRRRKEPYTRLRVYGLLGLSAALALSALAGYAAIRGERVEAYRGLQERQMAASNMVGKAPAFHVQRYDLKLTYDKPAVGVTAELEVRLPKDAPNELTFTLRDSFKIDSVKADGKEAAFRREGDLVSVELGESAGKEEAKLTFSYSGRVDDWRVLHPYGGNPGNMIVPVHIARADRVFLPGRYGWYPIPGGRRLNVQDDKYGSPVKLKLQEDEPAAGLSDYKLTVFFPNSLNLFSNAEMTGRTEAGGKQTVTFEGEQIDGITLLGGQLKEIAADTAAPKLRLIAGGLADERAVKELLPILEEAVTAADEERKVARTGPLTIMSFDLVYGYGDGRNLGGMMSVKSNLFLYSHEEKELKEMFKLAYASYLNQLESAKGVRQ